MYFRISCQDRSWCPVHAEPPGHSSPWCPQGCSGQNPAPTQKLLAPNSGGSARPRAVGTARGVVRWGWGLFGRCPHPPMFSAAFSEPAPPPAARSSCLGPTTLQTYLRPCSSKSPMSWQPGPEESKNERVPVAGLGCPWAGPDVQLSPGRGWEPRASARCGLLGSAAGPGALTLALGTPLECAVDPQ